MKNLIFLAIIFSLSSSAYAFCYQDNIKTITNDGSIIITNTGKTLEIDEEGRDESSQWFRGDQLTVCDDDSITHDSDGEKIDANEVNKPEY